MRRQPGPLGRAEECCAFGAPARARYMDQRRCAVESVGAYVEESMG